MEQTSTNKKYIVRVTTEEREHLEDFVSKGKRAAYKIKHANILLKANADGPEWTDEGIAEAFSVHAHTVRRALKKRVETPSLCLLVYSSPAERGIRGTDGGYFGPVLFAL